jgi:hypothetical protein
VNPRPHLQTQKHQTRGKTIKLGEKQNTFMTTNLIIDALIYGQGTYVLSFNSKNYAVLRVRHQVWYLVTRIWSLFTKKIMLLTVQACSFVLYIMKRRALRTSIDVAPPTAEASRSFARRSVCKTNCLDRDESSQTNDELSSRQTTRRKFSCKQPSTSTILTSTSSDGEKKSNELIRTVNTKNQKKSSIQMDESGHHTPPNDVTVGSNDPSALLEDEDSEYNDEEEMKKRQRTCITNDVSNNNDGTLVCPNCLKNFVSSLGLQYHMEQFVCQPKLRPGGPIKRLGRRKIKRSDNDEFDGTLPTKTYKKIRGNINDRTCPQCKRVFTSVAGMQYHHGT